MTRIIQRTAAAVFLQALVLSAAQMTMVSVATANTTQASVVPSGRLVYIRVSATSTTNIFTSAADGTGEVQLTNDGSSRDPAWSPDGTHIAFVSSRDSPSGAVQTDRFVYVMNADGSGVQEVTFPPCTNDPINCIAKDGEPEWSPDGTQIYFVRSGYQSMPQEGGRLAFVSRGFPGVVTAIDPGILGTEYWPDPSPIGGGLAFTASTCNACNAKLYVLSGGNSARITPTPAGGGIGTLDGAGRWAPDGSALIYTSDRNLVTTPSFLYLTSPDGSTQTQITGSLLEGTTLIHAIQGANNASWTPDGRQVLFDTCSYYGGCPNAFGGVYEGQPVVDGTFTLVVPGAIEARAQCAGSSCRAELPCPTGYQPAGFGCMLTAANTPTGANVQVSPVDTTTGGVPVTLTFSSVTGQGTTTLTTSSTGPIAPSGLLLGSPPSYYNLATSASFSGTVQICIFTAGITFVGAPALYHFDGSAWVNVTDPAQSSSTAICGTVTSLSPFALFTADSTAPVLTLPANLTVSATSSAGAVVTYTVTASDPDNTAAELTISCLPASGSTFPLGTTPVNCAAKDPTGNTAPGGFTITVSDTSAPVLTLPANMTVTATSPAGAAVTYAVTASDPDNTSAELTISCLPASGSTFLLGTTPVNCTAKDPTGNTAAGGFSVTVTAPPDPPLTITNIGAVAFHLDALAGVTFTDSDRNGTLTQYSVVIDWGDHSKPSAAAVARYRFGGGFAAGGTHHYAARGTYTITVTVTDVQGATTTRSTTLEVRR